jgi:hypothetical protein
MATYDDLFGGKSGGSGSFVRAGQEGETLLMVQTGEIKKVPQQVEVDGKKYNKWLVQPSEDSKWKVVPQMPGFDESDYHGAFQPNADIHVPVKVVAKKLKNGEKDETFEPYDATWDLGAGDQMDKFKDAMLESGAAAIEGTKYSRKLLTTQVKPYKYAIKMQAGK